MTSAWLGFVYTWISLWDPSTAEAKRLPRGDLGPTARPVPRHRAAWIRQRAASRIPLSSKSSAAPPHAQVLRSGFGSHGSARPSNRIREYIKSQILPSSMSQWYRKSSGNPEGI
ncbi:hypothetical protein E2C01_067185 [Portunus trituberculatus]|uniref:Uncharacterized protein n=1 Tax=Portunus trituberculatus TaxID=210409 RepID=A0A5B7HJ53_PORTR|nr:hypothetical protein [Portunus trituberculatus]